MCGDIGTTSKVCAFYSFTGILFTVSSASPRGWELGKWCMWPQMKQRFVSFAKRVLQPSLMNCEGRWCVSWCLDIVVDYNCPPSLSSSKLSSRISNIWLYGNPFRGDASIWLVYVAWWCYGLTGCDGVISPDALQFGICKWSHHFPPQTFQLKHFSLQ
jgi:hypothetical protein